MTNLQRSISLRAATLSLGGLLACLPASGEAASSPPSRTPQASRSSDPHHWYFDLRVRNETKRPIHVVIRQGGASLGETVIPLTAERDVRPATPLAPAPAIYPTIRVLLDDRIQTLDVEETILLKTTASFNIQGFQNRLDLDFDVTVSERQLTLSQDWHRNTPDHSPSTPAAASQFQRDRQTEPLIDFDVKNLADHLLAVRVLADGEPYFDETLPATGTGDDVPHNMRNRPPYWKTFLLSVGPNLTLITVEVTEPTGKRTAEFSGQSLLARKIQYEGVPRIEITNTTIRFMIGKSGSLQ